MSHSNVRIADDVNDQCPGIAAGPSTAIADTTNTTIGADLVTAVQDLATIALEANALHEKAQASAVSFVEYAIQCGQKLIEAKALCGHGNWLPWLEANFKATERTAQKYMTVASNTNRGSYLTDTIKPESIRQALRELAAPESAEHSITADTLAPDSGPRGYASIPSESSLSELLDVVYVCHCEVERLMAIHT